MNTTPWLSDSGRPYVRNTPYFFDVDAIPAIKEVERNFEVIRDELLKSLQVEESPFEPYGDLTKTDRKQAWKTAGLMYWTLRSKPNIRRFPKTWEIMRRIPNLSACSLLLLEPRSTIKPHIGDTDAMYRCHMGLVVPAGLPQCGFRCGDESRPWVAGRVFAFNDACEHTAWNNTEERRFILSFDILRPQFEGAKYWTSANVLGKIYVEILEQHAPIVKRLGKIRWLRSGLFKLSKAWWYARVRWHAIAFSDPIRD